MTRSDTAVEPGSGNVFADLGLPDADAHIVKAELVARIDAIVQQRGITQAEAGRLLGLSQPDVSRLLRGDFREYSLERRLRLLTALWTHPGKVEAPYTVCIASASNLTGLVKSSVECRRTGL